MTDKSVRNYMKSRWDARFLIKTIMGLLPYEGNPSSDFVLSVVAAAIRGYSKGYSNRHEKLREERIYQIIKEYAREKSNAGGKDAELMENFLSILVNAEEEIWGQPTIQRIFAKPCAVFPMSALDAGEELDFKAYSRDHFRAKFYRSECEPIKGILVFDDEGGLADFGDWMNRRHPQLSCPEFDDGSWKYNPQL
ncbi:hypothetical protein M1N45_03795 [Dehalococcoidia bacterium]|nr:hypothetical protein [Dehalococcoidia bacterium]